MGLLHSYINCNEPQSQRKCEIPLIVLFTSIEKCNKKKYSQLFISIEKCNEKGKNDEKLVKKEGIGPCNNQT